MGANVINIEVTPRRHYHRGRSSSRNRYTNNKISIKTTEGIVQDPIPETATTITTTPEAAGCEKQTDLIQTKTLAKTKTSNAIDVETRDTWQ